MEEITPQKSRKKFWLIGTGFFIVLVLAGLYFAWQWYLSPEAKQSAQIQKNIELYNTAMKNYEDAMRADTYGSSTPEGTLQMFIKALQKGDAELASKYFLLDETRSRTKWEDALREYFGQNGFSGLVAMLLNARPAGSSMEGRYGFEVLGNDGVVTHDIGMRLNKYSGVWKIESM